MNQDQVRTLFEVQQQHWRARDPAKLAESHTEDGVLVSPIFRTVTGRPAIRASYESLFSIFPDWDYRPTGLLVDGNRAAEPFVVTATHVGEFMGLAGCGRRVEIQGVRLFEFADGLIARERRYYDFTGMLIQLGVLRSKPSL